jgi:hypothetical protein
VGIISSHVRKQTALKQTRKSLVFGRKLIGFGRRTGKDLSKEYLISSNSALHFELTPALSEDSALDVAKFLDTQDNSHPFLFPQWTRLEDGKYPSGTRFAILRQEGRIKFFARCNVQHPLGRYFPMLRALSMPRGPCSDPLFWERGLRQYLESSSEAGFAFLEAAPEVVAGADSEIHKMFQSLKWAACGQARASLRLDITKSEDDLLAGLRKTTRYEVHKAERSGVQVRSAASKSDFSDFLTLYSAMAERKQFTPDPLEHLRRIFSWLAGEPARGTLLVAHHRDAMIGGAVIIRAARRSWYIWGASARSEAVSAGPVLQWKGLLWAKQNGCMEYDFGGYQVNATSGPALFKKGFGGEVVQFLPPQRLVVSPTRCRIIDLVHGLNARK